MLPWHSLSEAFERLCMESLTEISHSFVKFEILKGEQEFERFCSERVAPFFWLLINKLIFLAINNFNFHCPTQLRLNGLIICRLEGRMNPCVGRRSPDILK